MASEDKSVFVSYRRPNLMRALAISQKLSARGYDVYFDHSSSSNSGVVQANLEQIKIRPHFLLILTPTALDLCGDPNDPMRREIEAAFGSRNSIISLLYDGADFENPTLKQRLIGGLNGLLNCPHVTMSRDNFDQSMFILYSELDTAAKSIQGRWMVNALLGMDDGESAGNGGVPGRDTTMTAQELSEHAADNAGKSPIAMPSSNVIEEIPVEIEISPSSENEKAFEWFNQGGLASDFNEIIYCYTEAIRLKPDFAMAYNNRGIVLASKRDWNRAIQDYSRAIELDPESYLAYVNRGEALCEVGNPDGAIQDCNTAIRLEPDCAMAYNNRGKACEIKGDWDGVIQDCSRAIELDPESYVAYTNRGFAFCEKNAFARAIQDCTTAIRLNPNFAAAYYNRGRARYKIGDLDGVIEDNSEAIRLNPDYGDAYRNRALIWLMRKNYHAAVADLEKCVALGEKDPGVHAALQEAEYSANLNFLQQ